MGKSYKRREVPGKPFDRRELPYSGKRLEEKVNLGSSHEPSDMFEALMLNMDDYEDFSDFSPLREEVINAVEQLSEKDRTCINAIYSEQITYEELGERLGYSPQPNGSPQAYFATKRALERLKKVLLRSPIIAEYVAGLPHADE